MAEKFTRWTMEDCLRDEEDIAEYLSQVAEDGDPEEMAYALGVVARAKGMSKVAREADVSRVGLYSSLAEGGDPRLSTFSKVLKACGMRMRIEPIPA